MSNVGGIRSGGQAGGLDASAGTPEAAVVPVGAGVTLGSDLLKSSSALAAVAAGTAEVAFGARGDAAKLIQQALTRLGFSLGAADGIYGRQTQAAVASFQRQNGLAPSGNVDSATLAAIDRKLVSSAGSGASTPAGGPARPATLLFVGMGDGASAEADHLKAKLAATGGGLMSVTDSKVDDEVSMTVAGRARTYKLSTREGCDAYARDLGLKGPRAAEVASIIFDGEPDARDELSQIARAFAEAESGTRRIERMVISGHSVGDGVWGDHNGYLELENIAKLARAFPVAARQVEDFMVAGCYSGGESAMEQFQGMFPNLKTAWAYTGSAPGTWSGALPHLERWERGTRGHDPSALSRDAASGTRKGENVAVWTATKGYDDGQPLRPISDLRRELESGRTGFAAFLSGEREVADTQQGPVRDYYNSIQRLLQHPQLPAADRPALEAARDQVIRLNFYGMIREKFQQANGATIQAGFRAAGLEAPDFAKLSRKEALAAIADFERRVGGMNPKPQAAAMLLPLLTEGLRDLKPSRIPNTWI